MPYLEEGVCVAAIGSMTMAIKGSRILAQGGISAQIIALSASETRRGCGYGVSYSCGKQYAVQQLFKNARFPVSQYLQRGGGL